MPHYRLHRDPRSSHQQIAHLVRRLGQGPLLDVGAAQGILGQLLYDWAEGVVLDAVEPNRDWAGRARPFYRQVFGWDARTSGEGEQAYTEWLLNGRSIGGMVDMTGRVPDAVPPHWLTYFSVAD